MMRGIGEYRRKGPPALALRITGPFLLLGTLILLSSGITLLLAPGAFGGPHGTMYHIHAFSSLAWVLLILVHLAGHARHPRHLSARDWMRRTRAAVPGARARQAITLASLAAGLALALALIGHTGTYLNAASHPVSTPRQPGNTATSQPAQPPRASVVPSRGRPELPGNRSRMNDALLEPVYGRGMSRPLWTGTSQKPGTTSYLRSGRHPGNGCGKLAECPRDGSTAP